MPTTIFHQDLTCEVANELVEVAGPSDPFNASQFLLLLNVGFFIFF